MRLESPRSNSFLIFIWHHPDDGGFATETAEQLSARGFETISMVEIGGGAEPSFTVDWQMSQSDCMIFLISKKSVQLSTLQTDAEKVMRREEALVIPVFLDEIERNELPLILHYIQPIYFQPEDAVAFERLFNGIQSKLNRPNSTQRTTSNLSIKPIRWTIEHFRRYLTLSPLTFCWQITVENLIVSLSVTGLIFLIWEPSPRTNLQNITASTYLWSIIILSPIIETLLLQAVPVFLARLLGFQFFGQLLFSIVPFAALHFTRSLSAGIGAGIVGGFYSAFTYIHWQSKSSWTAFWVTAFSHALYNLALFAMLIGEF